MKGKFKTFVCMVILMGGLLPSYPAAAETEITARHKKPSGNFCGKDDFRPKGTEGQVVEFSPPGVEHSYTEKEVDSGIAPRWFDKYTFISEGRACHVGRTVAEYRNRSKSKVTHKFSEEASHSTTFNTSIDADFHSVFKATMGYAATHTVTKKAEFTVELYPGESLTLIARPSLAIITGKWSYLFGSKIVTSHYPTHITWDTI